MKKTLIIVVGLIALVALAYFKKTGQSAAVEVKIQQVQPQDIKRSILASGTLVYKQQVQLRSEVIGQVQEVLVEEGEPVKKGQVLMRLDPRTFIADVKQQEALVRLQTIAIERQQKQLEFLKAQWQRKHDLYQRQLLDQDSFESIDNQYQLAKIDLRSREESLTQAKATLEKAHERLDKTVFRSPIDGIATSVDIKKGETAISGTTNIAGSNLITVADPSSILIEVEVDEADIADVREGQKADIFAVAFPETPMSGTVQNIATTAKRSQGRQGLSFKVKILLDETSQVDVRPGMSCRAEIYTQHKEQVLAVPSEAVVFTDNSKDNDTKNDTKTASQNTTSNLDKPASYVFVFADNVAHKRPVSLGISNDRFQEITEGLTAGEQVIIGPARALNKLKDQQAVRELKDKNKAKDKA